MPTHLLSVLLFALCGVLNAADAADTAVTSDVVAAFEAASARKDLPAMEAACRTAMVQQPRVAAWPYNLACTLVPQRRTAEALAALRQAADLGFTDDGWMRDDPDLADLRQDPAFIAICDAVHAAALAAPYERGAEIAGVTTVEDWPARGLRYRLRIPAGAGPGHPARLVVWLHPSGGSANHLAESLVPGLAARNLALLVCTSKNWRGWSNEDARRLIAVTVPALTAQPAIDVRRPYLLGFSAGGQMALSLWQQHPESFAGLLLCAAYPVETGEQGYPPLRLPATPAGSRIFALVGAKDPGVATFRKIETAWTAAGIDLTWQQVPGRGHEFLFTGRERDALYQWLDAQNAREPGRSARP